MFSPDLLAWRVEQSIVGLRCKHPKGRDQEAEWSDDGRNLDLDGFTPAATLPLTSCETLEKSLNCSFLSES